MGLNYLGEPNIKFIFKDNRNSTRYDIETFFPNVEFYQ